MSLNLHELRQLPEELKAKFISNYTADELDALWHHWPFVGRREQQIPEGEWTFWLYLAGRGAGKTRTGAETVKEWVKQGYGRIGMIAPTTGDTRAVMVEGESGLLATAWKHDVDIKGNPIGVPLYEPSKRRLTWANGAIAELYSAEEPERLRGPQHEMLWADELAAWKYAETWDLAMFGLRLGKAPKAFISTTPKPTKLLIDILKNPATVVTRGTTYDNRANLAPAFFKTVITKYEGTRLGRQELMGDLLEESDQALWTRSLIDETRVKELPEGVTLRRIVIAVDPAVSDKSTSNETGIVAVGFGSDKHVYVIGEYSGRYSPDEWARTAIAAYQHHQADCIVYESNQGGDLVKHTIQTVNANVPLKAVRASRGKMARAEPVAALWEQRKAHILGTFPTLEDQLCQWEPLTGKPSPDRLDAMVWGVTEVAIVNSFVGQGKLKGTY